MSQFNGVLTVVNFYYLAIYEVVSETTLTLLEQLLIKVFLEMLSLSVFARAAYRSTLASVSVVLVTFVCKTYPVLSTLFSRLVSICFDIVLIR